MRILLQSARVAIMLAVSASLFLSGCTKSNDSTITTVPTLYTSPILSNLTATAGQSTGYITDYVVGTVSAYGTCFSTSATPTIADSRTIQTTSNILFFYSDLIGLVPNTVYYMRTYATVSDVTYYGNTVTFKTPTRTFNISGNVSTYAGTGTPGATNGTLTTATFNSPQAIVFDATSSSFYVADAFNNVIRKISSTGAVTIFAGGTTPGYTDATGTAARFYSPQYLAIDAAGNLYVSDVGNNVIRKITPAGVVTTLAGSGKPGYADGSGATVRFYNPAGLAVDALGNVYLADKGNNSIRKITAAGVVSTYLTYGTNQSGFYDGTLSPRFNNPYAVAIDPQNNLYVADLGNNAIRLITPDGQVNTILGNPTTRIGLLNYPASICIDKTGNVFIADESGRVMEIPAANRALYSLAGTANTVGFDNGIGTAATFSNPQGITTDAAGNLYVADYGNNVIRKVVITTAP